MVLGLNPGGFGVVLVWSRGGFGFVPEWFIGDPLITEYLIGSES